MLNKTFKNKKGLSKYVKIHKIFSIKYLNKRKYANRNTSVLPLKNKQIYL